MTMVFGRDDETVIVGVMTDSLRRASPARFSGFYLSRLLPHGPRRGLGGTPASGQFRAEALRMQGLSQVGKTSCCVQPHSGTPRNPREPPLRLFYKRRPPG